MGLFSSPSYAQICQEPNSSDTAPSGYHFINCDLSYRDTVVTCDYTPMNVTVFDASLGNYVTKTITTPATRPSCPAKPMPMIKTPLASLISSYTPYLYAYAHQSSTSSWGSGSGGTDGSVAINNTKMYDGPFSVGTAGGPDKVFGMVTTVDGDKRQIAGCTAQVQPAGRIPRRTPGAPPRRVVSGARGTKTPNPGRLGLRA